MELGKIIPAVLLFAVLIGVYITLYLLNRKTPKPAGCENLRAECKGCQDFLCMNNPVHELKETE